MLLYLYHGVCRTLAHLMSEVYSKHRQMYKIIAYTGIFRNIQQDSILMIFIFSYTHRRLTRMGGGEWGRRPLLFFDNSEKCHDF